MTIKVIWFDLRWELLSFHTPLAFPLASVCGCVYLSRSVPAVKALPSSFLSFPTMPCLKLPFQRKKNTLFMLVGMRKHIREIMFCIFSPWSTHGALRSELWDGPVFPVPYWEWPYLGWGDILWCPVCLCCLTLFLSFSCEYDHFVVVNTLRTVYLSLFCPISISQYFFSWLQFKIICIVLFTIQSLQSNFTGN